MPLLVRWFLVIACIAAWIYCISLAYSATSNVHTTPVSHLPGAYWFYEALGLMFGAVGGGIVAVGMFPRATSVQYRNRGLALVAVGIGSILLRQPWSSKFTGRTVEDIWPSLVLIIVGLVMLLAGLFVRTNVPASSSGTTSIESPKSRTN